MPNKNDATDKAQLEAPLAVPADQLELVAGGVALTRIGVIGPTNGILMAVKLDALAQISVPSQIAL